MSANQTYEECRFEWVLIKFEEWRFHKTTISKWTYQSRRWMLCYFTHEVIVFEVAMLLQQCFITIFNIHNDHIMSMFVLNFGKTIFPVLDYVLLITMSTYAYVASHWTFMKTIGPIFPNYWVGKFHAHFWNIYIYKLKVSHVH